MCVDHASFIHPCVSGHLISIVDNAAVNMVVQLSLQILAFNSFGCVPRSGFAGLYDSSICNFCGIA